MSLFETDSNRKLIGRRAGGLFLGVAVLTGMATTPGCDGSGGTHVADPSAGAKTLVDPNASQPTRKTSNKQLQKRIDAELQDIAKHPKVR